MLIPAAPLLAEVLGVFPAEACSLLSCHFFHEEEAQHFDLPPRRSHSNSPGGCCGCLPAWLLWTESIRVLSGPSSASSSLAPLPLPVLVLAGSISKPVCREIPTDMCPASPGAGAPVRASSLPSTQGFACRCQSKLSTSCDMGGQAQIPHTEQELSSLC